MAHRDGVSFFQSRSIVLFLGGVWAVVLLVGCAGPRESSRGEGAASDDRSGTRIKRVYLVQIQMTERKAVADRTVGEVKTWWRNRSVSERPRTLAGIDELPVTIAWRPPLYRVRIGPFASRHRAEVMLDVVDGTYPDAFIAPQRVKARTPTYRPYRPFTRHSRH